MRNYSIILIWALAFYVVWTLATWYFEGRIGTLLRPEATVDRLIYALAVNLLFAVAGGIVLLRYWGSHASQQAVQSGFGGGVRTVASIVVGLALGLALYFLQGAPSTNAVVIVNAFAQVLVVSTAEVLVCWGLVGASLQSFLRNDAGSNARAASNIFSIVLAGAISSALFGIYHFAHSVPFNTWPMVVLLTVVGLFTSVFFFISRDIAGTILFHNFLGTFGVVQALSAARALPTLEQWQPPLIATALLTVCVLAAGYWFLRRGADEAPTPTTR